MWAFLVYPAVATILFNVDIYVWHLPVLYDSAFPDFAERHRPH